MGLGYEAAFQAGLPAAVVSRSGNSKLRAFCQAVELPELHRNGEVAAVQSVAPANWATILNI